MKNLMLIANNLQKFYNRSSVFREKISFELGGGEILFVYGKNGSGKTTLLRILAGITEPDSGEVKLNGEKIYSTRGRFKVFFVGHEPALYKHLSALENIELWSKIYGKSPCKEEIEESLTFFGVQKFLRTEVRALSQGTKKKVYLSLYNIIRPDLFIVDEPFSNLDEDGQKKLTELFLFHVRGNGILILSSPEKDDVRKMVGMGEGRIKVFSL